MVTKIVYLQGFLKIKFATDMEGQKVFLYGPNIILTFIFSSLPSEVWLQNQKWFTIGSIHSFSSEQPFILAAFTKEKKNGDVLKPKQCKVLSHSGNLRTLEKCRKHSPEVHAFSVKLEIISPVFLVLVVFYDS